MSENYRSTSTHLRDLIKLPPLVLYEIASDIQVSEKWKSFAFAVGFSIENVMMIEMSGGDRFPAENVMYHWFSKNPKVDDLARILCNLNLEKALRRLEIYMPSESFAKHIKLLHQTRNNFINSEMNLKCFQENQTDNNSDINYQTQMSNSSTSSTCLPTSPEPGSACIESYLPTVTRSSLLDPPVKEFQEIKLQNAENVENEMTLFQTILDNKSTKFSVDEFIEEDFDKRFIEGKFSSYFCKKLRGNTFMVQSFSLEKILKFKKNQKKLYNIIWSLLNFRLHSLPILTGYCLLENYLFLIYPFHETKSLFDVLHRPHISKEKTMSSTQRLMILRVVGEALSFLHCSIPFGACHGHINSHNVFVGCNVILLSGFERFYTEDTNYLKGLNNFSKPEIQIEEYYRRDILDYLELICETWWNIQPYKKNTEDESLLDDIVNNISFPKLQYGGWRESIHNDMRDMVIKYNSQTKITFKVEEIVDDLKSMDSSYGPPSYKEIEENDFTKCF